jgi:uncharacterized protein (TIGR02266 family)
LVDPNTRQGKRTPVTLKIKFKSETLDQFIERYAVDVSQGGIFIRTKEPLAVGTQMKFEFQLRDASPLIAGEGTVVWTRENDPSRPAIAPGMGVRFDRLADGSQGILERILTEKAKQAPQRPAPETTKPPLFTDTPTRVAPAPMQDALLGKANSRRRDDVGHSDSHTPLPKPMPFHTDAEEFPDEAFEEATKVRALDDLIAQTAEDDRPENTSRSRPNGRGDGLDPADRPDMRQERPEKRHDIRPLVLPSQAELQDVPDLPNPPDMRPQPRLLENSPPPRIESMPPSLPDALAKTRLGVEPARARIGGPTPPPPLGPPSSPSGGMFGPPPGTMPLGEIPALPSGMRAVAAEQTEPARMPPLRSRSVAPMIILICLLVAAGGAAVWFFFLRAQISESHDHGAQPESTAAGPTGSAAAASGSAGGAAAGTPAASGSAAPGGSAAPAAGSGGAGSAVAAAAGSAAAPAKADLADTIIAASTEGAAVEITGTNQSGPAPFTAKLEKGKPYKARISAHGFAALELDIKGGDPRQTAKLVAKPRLISLTTDPAGAQILLDGTSTGHTTPFELELTGPQAAKRSVRITLRKQGFKQVDRTLEAAKFTEDDTRMTFKIDEKLATAPVVTSRPAPRPPAGGSGSDGAAAGSDAAPAGGSQGSAGAGAPSNDGPVTTPTPAPAQPPAAPPGGSAASGGAATGSAEPEPDFNKH